jgi:hypothetical protein
MFSPSDAAAPPTGQDYCFTSLHDVLNGALDFGSKRNSISQELADRSNDLWSFLHDMDNIFTCGFKEAEESITRNCVCFLGLLTDGQDAI